METVPEAGVSQDVVAAPPLDEEILKALKANVLSRKVEINFHHTLVECWRRILRDGLKKEEETELLEKYPRAGNCRVEAPVVNEEVESIFNEKMRKRDIFYHKIKMSGSGLSALAITMILNEKDGIDKLKLLELLNDADWLMSDLFHLLTIARRSFLFASIDRKMRSILEKDRADELLFGVEFSQRIKSAKAAEKVGSSLKFQLFERKFPARQIPGN